MCLQTATISDRTCATSQFSVIDHADIHVSRFIFTPPLISSNIYLCRSSLATSYESGVRRTACAAPGRLGPDWIWCVIHNQPTNLLQAGIHDPIRLSRDLSPLSLQARRPGRAAGMR